MKNSKATGLPEKWCNLCGADTVNYVIVDNAPLCFNCRPDLKPKKDKASNLKIQGEINDNL